MNEKVLKYVQKLEKEKVRIKGEIASKERALSRIEQKLADPENHLAKELGRGAVKVSRLLGGEVAQKPKTLLKRKLDVSEGSQNSQSGESVAPEMTHEDEKPKKSSWSFYE